MNLAARKRIDRCECCFRYCLVAIGILAVAFPTFSFTQVTVEVSPRYSAISHSGSVRLGPDEKENFQLRKPPLSDKYKLVFAVTSGELRTIIFDQSNVVENNPNPIFLLDQHISGSNFISLPNGQSSQGIVVAIWNDSERPVFLNYEVFRIGQRSPEVVREVQDVVEIPIRAFERFYRLPKFKVKVIPCGEINAYSGPDITICSELLADLYEKDLTRALYPIIYHEMAHTLLNLWNLPGFDNEDMADQFSAVMLARVRPTFIEDFISYLELNDSTKEAVVQLTKGSQHTLSIQRARNIRTVVKEISQFEKRWGKLLEPYEIKRPTLRQKGKKK